MEIEAAHLANIVISKDGLVFDPVTGNISTSNTVGTVILRYLKDGKTTSEIKHEIMKTYDVKEPAIEKDMIDFINQLSNCEIIE
ncbi:MAG: PqqD family protein [Candidatus Poribacteria bacterium]